MTVNVNKNFAPIIRILMFQTIYNLVPISIRMIYDVTQMPQIGDFWGQFKSSVELVHKKSRNDLN